MSTGHRQRLKKKYLENNNLSDLEFLELLLFYAYPRIDTKTKAKEFINKFGSIDKLFSANPQEIMENCKTTENVAILISLLKPKREKAFLSSKEIGYYAMGLYPQNQIEEFFIILLNKNKELIKTIKTATGTTSQIKNKIKTIIVSAIESKASFVVLIHNHPSNSNKPSKEDVEGTKSICTALNYIDVKVIDHIIVVDHDYLSFAEIGIIK
ncbi:MAG: JAB domain-containing protein [Lachnospirales bacterium]